MDNGWIDALAGSPWLVLALFALVVGDAFLVVLPSETAVVALGALWATTGTPSRGCGPRATAAVPAAVARGGNGVGLL